MWSKTPRCFRTATGRVLGAVETLTDITELDVRDRKIKELSRMLGQERGFHGMVGRSEPMRRLYALLERAAQSDAPVIIFGESGTGKELAATALHELGLRKDGPFVQINCAALNDALLESEIFGHVKGAFTGAYRHRTGRFEEACGGDVFLDEIGDVPLSTQIKLLRVLETRSFERVGDSRPLPLDARLITATNQDLRQLVQQGSFREDFFYRINVIPLQIPPLRDRRDDIPLLAEHFLRNMGKEGSQHLTGISPQAMELLVAHSWPGNVRELKSALEYAAVVCDGEIITQKHLPPQIAASCVCTPPLSGPFPPQTDSRATSAPASGPDAERTGLIEALRTSKGNKSAAARLLGVSRVTVLNRMRKHGIDMQKVITS